MRRHETSRAGSTLVWVMVVILVLVIVLGVGLAAASGRFNLSATRHKQQQAYYTALSSTQTIADWLVSDGNSDDARKLFEWLAVDGDDALTFVEEGLPAAVGSCVVVLSYVDDVRSTLKISSTATFAGTSETVSLTLTKDQGTEPFTGQMTATNFTPAAYDERAAELNKLTLGTSVIIGDQSAANNSNANATDIDTLNNGRLLNAGKKDETRDISTIVTADSDKEAWWTHLKGTGANKDPYGTTYYSEVLGGTRFPLLGSGGTDTDGRRFVVPKNGRLVVNPLEEGEHHTDNDHSNMMSETKDTNTKLSSLAIDTGNAETGDILFRLANVGLTTNRLNALLMLTFTDFKENAGGKPVAEDATDGKGTPYTWHPNDWDSLSIYLRSDAGLDTNVLIGPFGHKYDCFMDTYWSWGNYRDDVHGTTAGEFGKQWPYVSNTSHFDDFGLPMFPADYGAAGFWILDGNKDRYFRILQGVNIFNGSVYSTRPTIIGGGLIKNHILGHTTDNVNSGVDGFGEQTYDDYAAVYINGTLRYGQIITGTDIILKAPSSGTAQSVIRRPDTWRDRVYKPDSIPTHDKGYEPTMTIEGGIIYVGERQSLTIQGAVLDNMWISPRQIVVDTGGMLTIKASDHINVLTDIHVNGGTLVIEAGAKIKGNIYVYNGGTVDVRGGFLLEPPHSEAAKQEHDGILIYGADVVAADEADLITAAGSIKVPLSLVAFQGDSSAGKVHLVGGDWADLVKGAAAAVSPPNTTAAISLFLCGNHDPATGRCLHYGKGGSGGSGGSGGWIIGSFGSR